MTRLVSIRDKRVLAATLALALGGAATAQASLAGPRLFPRGARAIGVPATTFDATNNAYLFTLASITGATIVQYRVPLGHPVMVEGVLRVEETTTGVVPMAGGGLTYRDTLPGAADAGRIWSAYDLAFSPLAPTHSAMLLAHSLDSTGVVRLRYRDSVLAMPQQTRIDVEKEYTIRLVGRSLEIHARGDAAVRIDATYNYAGFAFGPGEGLPQPNLAFHVPYMDNVPVFVGNGGVFVTRIVDWYCSSASVGVEGSPPAVSGATFQGETAPAVYANNLRQLNAPIDETLYLTVSNVVEDVMPVVDRPPSEYRLHLADRAVSMAAPGETYATDIKWAEHAIDLGMTDMAHIKFDWGKWPFNLNEPDRIPAAPGVACGTLWGSRSEWLEYTNLAANANWMFAPYFVESTSDPGYPNVLLRLPGSPIGQVVLTPNPAYDPAKSVCDRLGQPKGGWDSEENLANTNLGGLGYGHADDVIGAHLRTPLLQAVVDAIRGANGYTPFLTGGAHTDAASSLPDWVEIDQRQNSGFPHTVAENLRWREISFATLKDGCQGPLFGEGSHWRAKQFDTYAMGLVDGTSRKIPINWSPQQGGQVECKDYFVVPDFELSEVLPKATGNQGMGWEKFFQDAQPWGTDDAFVDAWDTTALSYGHTAYFSTNGETPQNYWDWRRTIRSYYLCHGVGQAMRESTIQQVRYLDGNGAERNLSDALQLAARGLMDLTAPRLVLRFANGLEFKANHSAADWTTTVLGQTYVIPPNGFVAAAPSGLLALTAKNPASGATVDYAFSPGHSEVIDRRGRAQSYNGFPGALLPVPTNLSQFAGLDDREMVIVRDLRQSRAVYGNGMVTGVQPLGHAPVPVSLAIERDDTDTLSPGRRRLGMRAVSTDSLGHRRDVTGLCQWTSSSPTTISVNRFGGVALQRFGAAAVTAALPATNLTASHALNATGLPQQTPLAIGAIATTRVLLTCRTDIACTVTVALRDTVTGATVTLAGRPDPAWKSHQFDRPGLVSQRRYEATATAVDALGATSVGARLTFTTP